MKPIKVRCNGPGRHVNEIDTDKILQKDIVLRGIGKTGLLSQSIPERLVFNCKQCTVGEVILTREMIEDHLTRNKG